MSAVASGGALGAVAARPTPDLLALVGNPNCGKTALFNRLTGAHQKVANYAGVTVERKEGHFVSPQGKRFRLIDLPGAYSLRAITPDERITREVVFGEREGEEQPGTLIYVADATNLRLNLRMAVELKRLGRPMVLVLNMIDVARKRGIVIDRERLSSRLGMPVVETVAVKPGGHRELLEQIDRLSAASPAGQAADAVRSDRTTPEASVTDLPVEETQREVRALIADCVSGSGQRTGLGDAIDRVVLHPVVGPLLLAAIMFLVFQAVFSWAEPPMEWIKSGVEWVGQQIGAHLPEGMLKGLLIDGVINGAGSVLVFLPQILILFFFILVLEDSGYLPRAAFLLDRLMGFVGLSGRAFVPLLSSFACAIPGIMATRTIQSPRDRLVTIMIAPLMTCSARLPVYALIIAAFIPQREVAGLFNLQGLVLFALYIAGILSALAVAWTLKRLRTQRVPTPLLLELPDYHWPNLRNLASGLMERANIFLTRVGTIILSLMVLLWALANFPAPPEGASGPAIQYSLAGMIGRALEHVFAPIGFNWQICIALVPGLAAREVAVAALGTVYALSGTEEAQVAALEPLIAATWSLPTALSLLAWYVFAPQCIATLSVVKRETASWRYPLLMAGYLFALAWIASFIVYRVALAWLGH